MVTGAMGERDEMKQRQSGCDTGFVRLEASRKVLVAIAHVTRHEHLGAGAAFRSAAALLV